MFTLWLLYATIVFYSIVDAVQAKMLLDMGATELNPILNWFISEMSTVCAIFFVKAFWLILLFVLLKIKANKDSFNNAISGKLKYVDLPYAQKEQVWYQTFRRENNYGMRTYSHIL